MDIPALSDMFNIIETRQAWVLTFWENNLEAAAFLLPVIHLADVSMSLDPIISKGKSPSSADVQQVLFDENLV